MLILCQTKLCHTLALAAAEAETGLSRPNIDRAFIPVLLELMSDPGSRRGPDVPLQACRALNYFLQVCFGGMAWFFSASFSFFFLAGVLGMVAVLGTYAHTRMAKFSCVRRRPSSKGGE